jgi:hypothetical protein
MRILISAIAVLFTVCGCGGGETAVPHEDFPVIAQAASGDMVVYLTEARRTGTRISLVFRYRDTDTLFQKTAIECTEIVGGFETTYERENMDGWVEMKCETDYPAEAAQLTFILRMCEEPAWEKADISHEIVIPPVGEITSPGISSKAGNSSFSILTVAHLKGDSWPEMNGQRAEDTTLIPYGLKNVAVKSGGEDTLVIVCKAAFRGAIPELPRGYSETDQVIVVNLAGRALGGPPKAASDVGTERYYAKVFVSSEPAPEEIRVCFFTVDTLASFRREFAFSGLPNPSH